MYSIPRVCESRFKSSAEFCRMTSKRKKALEYIDDGTERQEKFQKRLEGIMKKAHELAVLTGNQVFLLMASETGSVHSYATAKFEPLLSTTTEYQFFKECMKDAGVDMTQISESQNWSTQDIHHPDVKSQTNYENVPIQFHQVEFHRSGTPVFEANPTVHVPTTTLHVPTKNVSMQHRLPKTIENRSVMKPIPRRGNGVHPKMYQSRPPIQMNPGFFQLGLPFQGILNSRPMDGNHMNPMPMDGNLQNNMNSIPNMRPMDGSMQNNMRPMDGNIQNMNAMDLPINMMTNMIPMNVSIQEPLFDTMEMSNMHMQMTVPINLQSMTIHQPNTSSISSSINSSIRPMDLMIQQPMNIQQMSSMHQIPLPNQQPIQHQIPQHYLEEQHQNHYMENQDPTQMSIQQIPQNHYLEEQHHQIPKHYMENQDPIPQMSIPPKKKTPLLEEFRSTPPRIETSVPQAPQPNSALSSGSTLFDFQFSLNKHI